MPDEKEKPAPADGIARPPESGRASIENAQDANALGSDAPPNEPAAAGTEKQEIFQRLQPYVQPGLANEAVRVVQSMLVRQSHSGPLPSSREFRGYEGVLPGAADRILGMAEVEQRHRHTMEATAIKSDASIKLRGQTLALMALVLLLVVVVLFAYLGHSKEGAALGAAVIVAVVAIFHGQKWFQKKNADDPEEGDSA